MTKSNEMIFYNNNNSSDLIFICSDKYLTECLPKVTPLFYNQEYDLFQTREGIGFRFLSIDEDYDADNNKKVNKFIKLLVDVNGIKGPNEDCQDRYIVRANSNGTVLDSRSCVDKSNRPVSSNSSNSNEQEDTSANTEIEETATNTSDIEAPVFNSDNNIYQGLKCNSTLDPGYGTCTSRNIKDFDVDAEDSVAINYSGNDVTYNQTSADGTQMTYEMALKTCEAKGMRLPEPLELNTMYNASQSELIPGFVQHEYWAYNKNCSSSRPYECNNCYMGAGNCGRASITRLNNVRCIK